MPRIRTLHPPPCDACSSTSGVLIPAVLAILAPASLGKELTGFAGRGVAQARDVLVPAGVASGDEEAGALLTA